MGEGGEVRPTSPAEKNSGTWNNYYRSHTDKEPANPYPRTPAMAAGIASQIWEIEDIIALTKKFS